MKQFVKRMLATLCVTVLCTALVPMSVLAAEEAPGARSHTTTEGHVFLGGKYIEVGLTPIGSFGALEDENGIPAGFHSTHTVNIKAAVGLVVDGDGFDVGEPPTTGDFFVPGTPEERYILGYKIDDTAYNHNAAYLMGDSWADAIQEPTTVDESDLSKGILRAVTTGITKENVKMTQVITFHEDDTFYKTEITIENLSSSTLTDVRYVRSFDPDQDNLKTGSYGTYDKVICNPDGSGSDDQTAMVVARGAVTLEPVFFLSFDSRARAAMHVSNFPNDVYIDGLWVETTPDLPTAITDEALAMTKDAVNGYVLDDNYIHLTTAFGDLAPGATAETHFYTSLDPDVTRVMDQIEKEEENQGGEEEPSEEEEILAEVKETLEEQSQDGGIVVNADNKATSLVDTLDLPEGVTATVVESNHPCIAADGTITRPTSGNVDGTVTIQLRIANPRYVPGGEEPEFYYETITLNVTVTPLGAAPSTPNTPNNPQTGDAGTAALAVLLLGLLGLSTLTLRRRTNHK